MRCRRSRRARSSRCSRACGASCPGPPSSASPSARRPPGVHDRQLVLERRTDSAALLVLRSRRRWRPPSRSIPEERRARESLTPMTKLNYWNETWSLDEAQCPCDLHFVEYLEEKKAKDAVDLPLRHRQPPHRRPEARRERLQLRRARHHRLAAGVRRLRRAADQEPAARPHLQGLLRRHLPARRPPAAAVRLRQPVPRRRVPHARERRLRRADRSRDDADAGRQDSSPAARSCSIRARSPTTRPRPSARSSCKQRPFEPAGAYKSLRIFRKRAG